MTGKINVLPRAFTFAHRDSQNEGIEFPAVVEANVVRVVNSYGNTMTYSVESAKRYIETGSWIVTSHRLSKRLPLRFSMRYVQDGKNDLYSRVECVRVGGKRKVRVHIFAAEHPGFTHRDTHIDYTREAAEKHFTKGDWVFTNGSDYELVLNKTGRREKVERYLKYVSGATLQDKINVSVMNSAGQLHGVFKVGTDIGGSKTVEQAVTAGVAAVQAATAEQLVETLGIYRPALEDRKVGKCRVELVDDGFPLALRELAKVMTWAQEAKGYKDHDWLNIPGGVTTLAAAASRHRTDRIIQRVQGVDELGCVDGESGLLHKAHEVFGVLAQLEIILRARESA